ncbi:MAG: lamin tail domain-containing protein [Anaerolineae bacterium]|nr:lamin tail domain-containing protein [Anaerolineae bacterium]
MAHKPVQRSIAQLLPYVIVNILVSAATMLLVLLLWQSAAQPQALPCVPQSTVPAETAQPQVAAIPPLEQVVITIPIVYGAGYVNNEQLVLERVGEGNLELYGWWLEDEDGNRYDFPPGLMLKSGAELLLNTRAGDDTPLELFWGRSEAVWTSGETARLYDPLGNLRAEYSLP